MSGIAMVVVTAGVAMVERPMHGVVVTRHSSFRQRRPVLLLVHGGRLVRAKHGRRSGTSNGQQHSKQYQEPDAKNSHHKKRITESSPVHFKFEEG
jgi:hypothetical protein